MGYPNTCSEFGISPKFFTNVLHFQGQRHATQNRYVHIMLNLPHGEQLDDAVFYELAKDYMEQMGFGDQPYCVVRHDDTKHEHIHIVSTTVTESASLINMFNSYRRGMATQRYLEKRYGLSPSPPARKKQQRELPMYRLPEVQFIADDTNGTKFYLQDVINGLLQKHRVRDFAELKQLARPYHIVVSTMTNENGRVGAAYGIDNQKKYNTQFINGYTVHPKLSGPKLVALFEKNSRSKLLPMHKKRLEKQLMTTFKLFKSIRQEDIPDVLKSYQNIDCEVLYGKKKQLKEIIVYDKSGYVFNASEISSQTDFTRHPRLMDNTTGATHIDDSGKQFQLEVRKLIKNAFYESYLNANKSDTLLSEFVTLKNFKDLLPYIACLERYSFLGHYTEENSDKYLLKILKNEFEGMRKELKLTETKKEIKTLENRVSILTKVLGANVFDTTGNNSIPFYLVQGLGLKYSDGKISYRNSKTHSVRKFLENFHLLKANESYISTGSIHQNGKVLEMLMETETGKDTDLKATAFFLPILLPELYDAMAPEYRKRFEEHSLRAYLATAEQLQAPYEKSPTDYIKLFNGKGFYFEQKQDKLYVSSIYSKHPVGIPIEPKTQKYLKSVKDLDAMLNRQSKTLDEINEKGRGQLKNLWLSHMIEKQLYGKAAFMMIHDGLRPNLDKEVMEHHMGNGLREKIVEVSNKKIKYQQASILRKSVYAFSSLLGGGYKEEEIFNGFKDEFTDFGKYKGKNRFV